MTRTKLLEPGKVLTVTLPNSNPSFWPNARERELILFNEILQRNVAERR